MTFTPGPWEVSMDGFTVNSDAAFYIANCEGVACHSDYSGTDFATDAHARANARLIAAAPDMLTALQEVLATPGLQSGLQAMCAAAIAKATGRDVADVIKGKRDDSAFEECMARLRNALDDAKGE